MCQQHRKVLNLKPNTHPGREINVRFVSGSNRISKQVSGDKKYLYVTATKFTESTYGDDDGGDESPADIEEERRREAQHHLDVFKVVPVTCDKKQKGIQEKSKVNIGFRSFILDLDIDRQYSMYIHMKAEDEESAGGLPTSFTLR